MGNSYMWHCRNPRYHETSKVNLPADGGTGASCGSAPWPPVGAHARTTESSPWCLRVGFTVISTSWPRAVRKSIRRSTEKGPD